MNNVGIDKIAFYTPSYYVNLFDIAQRDGIDPEKFLNGIGQERFSVASPDEDIVTMAVNAAQLILDDEDKQSIDTVIFATESAIDQSKSAAIYVQKLLGLPNNCRAIELKQACYSATAGLRFACDYVALRPDKKVLLIASDISRYDLYTPAEATQGAAAVAMLITANPRIANISTMSGLYTESVMDFWRPNYRETPYVDGKFSTLVYLRAAEAAYHDYFSQSGYSFDQFSQYCYHLPFSKMGIKAHQKLCRGQKTPFDDTQIINGMIYNREVGNSYTAALYLSLCSALDHRRDLDDKFVSMLSYGSGCVAEFFHLQIESGYQEQLQAKKHHELLRQRSALSLSEYETFWHREDGKNHGDFIFPVLSKGRFRLDRIENHQRIYVENDG